MGKFKKKFGRRILAYILSGAMIMSNMTAFASEPSNETSGYYEETVDDTVDNESSEEAEANEASKSESDDSDGKDDVKETLVETVEATETEDSEQATEKEASDDERTSETESSSVTETEETASTEEVTEAETESTEEASEEETTEVIDKDDDVKAEATHTFDATQLKSEEQDSQDLVVDDEEKLDKYFSVTGSVKKRVKNNKVDTFDGSITSVEVGAVGKSTINFTVTGTADVELVMSSTGGSNKSAVGLADASDSIIDPSDIVEGAEGTVSTTEDKITIITGTKKATIKYTGLPAGTYKVLSPSNPNPEDPDDKKSANNTTARGARVFSVKVTETTSGEGGDNTGDNDEQPDADGFYNGLEATTLKAARSYFYDFTGLSDIQNSYTKGLFSFDAGTKNAPAYKDTKYGIEFKEGNKLTFKVGGNSTIVVGGDNNNNCTALSASSDTGTFKPETLATKTEGHASLADCKTKGNNTLVYEYTGTEGNVSLTINDGKAYIAYVCIIPREDEEIRNPELTSGDGKIDVWDFGAEQLDAEKYNNKLTEDIINSWYPESVEPKSKGIAFTETFELKDSEGATELKWNNGGATNHRLRTTNTNLTRYDEKNLTYNGVTYNGYIYSNKEKTKDVNLQLAVQAGDVVTLVVSSNGKNSTISFESPSGEVNSKLYDIDEKDKTAIMTFYAAETGLYKIYTLDEKLCVARIYRERPNIVKVTGDITEVPDNIPAGYVLTFENQSTGAVMKAAVVDGKYEINLQECYKYTVGLSGADEFVVDQGRELDLTEKTGQDRTNNLTIKAVDLVDVTGSFTGLDEGILSKLDITFENKDKVYQPKLKIANNGYSTRFEKGVTYTVKVADKEKQYVVEDYILKTETVTTDGSVTTIDVAFEKKATHNVKILLSGDVTKFEDIPNAEYIFYYLDMTKEDIDKTNGYVYTFTDATQIALREGTYQVEVLKTGNYVQERTSNLVVKDVDVEKPISFSKEERTKWDFTTDKKLTGTKYGEQIQGVVGVFHGLEIDATGAEVNGNHVNGKFDSKNRTNDAQFNNYTKINVPVTGPCQVIVSVYDTKYTVNDVPAENKVTTVNYTASEPGLVTITATGNTYLNSIEVIYNGTVEFKDTIQVGADKEYKTINEALKAISGMNRTAEDGSTKRVTVEIAPGNYEEMLVVQQDNVTLKNASASPSIALKDKGVGIDDNAVRITWYYGHGYSYYSMGDDCKYDEELLAINKENGYASYKNPGAGSTDGSYWNASVVISADGFEADGIIFENSFNQYVSAKCVDDVLEAQSGAKEGDTPRAELKTVGDTTVQNKAYVERATALAITNNVKQASFNNCSFVGRQDVLYGGTGSTAAFYDCDVYGAVDYIFGGMTAVFAKCDLLLNTSDVDGDISYITAPQQQQYNDKDGQKKDAERGYLMYNCHIKSITPGVDSASEYPSKPSGLGRAWAGNTGEAVFYMTIIDATCEHWYAKGASLITPQAWYSGLSSGSPLCTEYGTFEYAKGVDNSASRETTLGGGVLTEEKLKDGSPITVATFLGDWNPFAGKDMEIVMPSEDDKVDNKPVVPDKPSIETGDVKPDLLTTEFINVSDMPVNTYSEKFKFGGIVITAGEGEEKNVVVEANDKKIDEYSFTQRLKLGGPGSADYRSIIFGAAGEGTLTLYAMSSSGDNNRTMYLYNADGTKIESSATTITGADISKYNFAVSAAGIYYLAAEDGGVNVYAVKANFEKSEPGPNDPIVVTTININDCKIAVSSILGDAKKNPDNMPKTSVVYEVKDDQGKVVDQIRFAEGLDYEVSKPVNKEGTNEWSVILKGKGRAVDEYRIDPESTVTKTFKVFDKKADKDRIIDLSKAKITLDGTEKGAIYTGYAQRPEVTKVMVGKDEITADKYKVSYKSNTNAGKASIIISADSDAIYAEGDKFVIGTKTVNFTIKKAAINKADQITVTAKDANGKDLKGGEYDYRGIDAVVAEELSVATSAGRTLRRNIDYTATYKNNRKAGKASLIIKGIGNNLSGSLTISYTIKPLDIGINSKYKLTTTSSSLRYSPNGAKLGIICVYNDAGDEIYLEEGVDFKVKYTYADKKNKAPGTNVDFIGQGINACTGYFSNSVEGNKTEFEIQKAFFLYSIYFNGDVVVDASKTSTSDKLQKAIEKAVVATDYYGVKLKCKKDYTVEVSESDKKVIIRPKEKSYYLESDYPELLGDPYVWLEYSQATNIKTVKPDKTYTLSYDGRNPVTLNKDDVSALLGGLKLNEDVEIVEGSYKNNYKAGNASVTIRGIGNYYGTVTIKFKIVEA